MEVAPKLGAKVEGGRPSFAGTDGGGDLGGRPRRGRTSKCFLYDRALLTTLVDQWRPEMHMFHFPCGEMALTLQDVSFLTGLPCTGFPMSAYEISPTWRTEFLARFQDVLPLGSDYHEFSSPHMPTLRWICQFYPEHMAADAPNETVRRHFEAYLL